MHSASLDRSHGSRVGTIEIDLDLVGGWIGPSDGSRRVRATDRVQPKLASYFSTIITVRAKKLRFSRLDGPNGWCAIQVDRVPSLGNRVQPGELTRYKVELERRDAVLAMTARPDQARNHSACLPDGIG